MPNRIIKESICTSDSIDSLSWFEEVLFYRLMVNCDDFGRFDGRAVIIKNRLFPLKESLKTDAVTKALEALSVAGLVEMYTAHGKPYLYLPTWDEHQNVRAKKSKYPEPDINVNTSDIICNQMQADVPVIQSNPIQSESNPYPNTNSRTRMARPTLQEVQEYISEKGYSVDAERFIAYYESNGWKVGKNPMKNWKAAVATWARSESGRRSRANIRIDTPQWHKDGKYNKESEGVVDEDLVREVEEMRAQLKKGEE